MDKETLNYITLLEQRLDYLEVGETILDTDMTEMKKHLLQKTNFLTREDLIDVLLLKEKRIQFLKSRVRILKLRGVKHAT